MDQETRSKLEEHERRMDRIEKNMEEFSEGLKKLGKQANRLNKRVDQIAVSLQTLLDALVMSRGNGHGKLPPPGE